MRSRFGSFRPIGVGVGEVHTLVVGLELIIDTFIKDIERGEFTVAALVGDEMSCDWAYSIGLHRCFKHPELLIVGLDADYGGAILELVGQQVAAGLTIEADHDIEVLDGLTLRPVEVDELWRSRGDWFALGQVVMASWGLRWPSTLQLLWPDRNGSFPSDPRDPGWILKQPVLAAPRTT